MKVPICIIEKLGSRYVLFEKTLKIIKSKTALNRGLAKEI